MPTSAPPVSLLTIALQVLIPALITVIGLVFNVVKDWGRPARKVRRVELETKRIDFWLKWHEGTKKLKDLDEGERKFLKNQLDEAATEVWREFRPKRERVKHTLQGFIRYRATIPAWRRALLLYHQPNKIANVERALMYLTPLVLYWRPVYDHGLLWHHHAVISNPHRSRSDALVILLTLASSVFTYRFGSVLLETKGLVSEDNEAPRP